MMNETFFDEQAGPVCPQASVDPADLFHPQIDISHENIYHLANLFSQISSLSECSPHQNPFTDVTNQEALSLYISTHLQALSAFNQDLSPLLCNLSNNFTPSTQMNYSASPNAYHEIPTPPFAQQSHRDFEAYYQVLNIMPFNDDEPIQATSLAQSVESRLNLSIQAETNDSCIDLTKTQSVPVKVTLTLAPVETLQRQAIDIICVIEKSQAVSPAFFEAVRCSVHKLLDNLNENDRLSLVLYDDFGYRITSLNRMSKDNKGHIRDGLHNVYLSGGVNLGDGIGQAMEIIRQRRYANPNTCVFVMGESNDVKSASTLEFLLQKYGSEKFTIHSFGCVEPTNNVLKGLANRRNGEYHCVDSKEEFITSLSQTLFSIFQNQSYELGLYFLSNLQIYPQLELSNVSSDNCSWAIPEKCLHVKIPMTEEKLVQEFGIQIIAAESEQCNNRENNNDFDLLDVVYRIETNDVNDVIVRKRGLKISLNYDMFNGITQDIIQTSFDEFDSIRKVHGQDVPIESLEKVNRLVAVEKLMSEADLLLQNNEVEEAKKVAGRLRSQAQGLGMEFETVIKGLLEKIYQHRAALSFDEFMEVDF